MFENIINNIKKFFRIEGNKDKSKETAKERLHLVLIQDRASVSADFLETMKQEIIDVIKKYIDVDDQEIDVRLTNNTTEDGKKTAPALYANFPITNVKINTQHEIKEDVKNEEVENEAVEIDNIENEKVENVKEMVN